MLLLARQLEHGASLHRRCSAASTQHRHIFSELSNLNRISGVAQQHYMLWLGDSAETFLARFPRIAVED